MQALLEQLRSSTAWQQTIGVSIQQPKEAVHADTRTGEQSVSGADTQEASPTVEHPSVASLLSQLQSSPAIQLEPSHVIRNPAPIHDTRRPLPTQPNTTTDPRLARRAAHPSASNGDLREYTFQQALPVIARLSEDNGFVEALRKVCFLCFLYCIRGHSHCLSVKGRAVRA